MTKTKKTKRTQIKDRAAQQELTEQELKTVKGGVGSPGTPVTPGTGTLTKYLDKSTPKLNEAISK